MQFRAITARVESVLRVDIWGCGWVRKVRVEVVKDGPQFPE